jgi:hypothetical protein
MTEARVVVPGRQNGKSAAIRALGKDPAATHSLSITPLEPLKAQLKRQGFHTTRRVRDKLDVLDRDRVALALLLSRGYLNDADRQRAAGILASRVFDALGIGRGAA